MKFQRKHRHPIFAYSWSEKPLLSVYLIWYALLSLLLHAEACQEAGMGFDSVSAWSAPAIHTGS